MDSDPVSHSTVRLNLSPKKPFEGELNPMPIPPTLLNLVARNLDLRRDHAGLTYWTLRAPVEEAIISNRCRKEDAY